MTEENTKGKQERIFELLAAAGLSKDMSRDELTALVRLAEEKRFSKGAAIIRENSKTRDLYIIQEGKVSIQLKIPVELGKDEVIYTMRDGQIFGELALVDGSPRSASVKAEGEVVVFCFDYGRLSALLDERPRIGYILMRNMATIIANRVRNTNLMWRNLMIW